MSIEELEILRKKARNIVLTTIGISLTISIVLVISFKTPAFIFIFFVGMVLSSIFSAKPSRKFMLAYKETFVLKSLNSIFDGLEYHPEKGLPGEIISNTGMMNMGDRYSSNDYISGKYKNINVVQADVHIEEEHESTDSDGHTTTTWVTIFRGRWMIFDFNKKFKANIQVCEKGFGNNRLYRGRDELKYQKVMMEDQEFNNKFKIYAQSDLEAFYVLTPSLMEKIKKLENSIKGSLLFCFVDNKLHIGLYNNSDSFEHSIFSKIDEQQVIKNISSDIKMITDFIDELNLDNDLFRREV